jgi:hypothetical protein
MAAAKRERDERQGAAAKVAQLLVAPIPVAVPTTDASADVAEPPRSRQEQLLRRKLERDVEEAERKRQQALQKQQVR